MTTDRLDLIEWNETNFATFYEHQTTWSNTTIYWYPQDSQLLGTETSVQSKNLALEIYFEPNRSCGMSFEEYMQEMESINLAIYSSNEFLNPFNFDDPIQTVLDDKYSVIIDPRVMSFYRYYIRK